MKREIFDAIPEVLTKTNSGDQMLKVFERFFSVFITSLLVRRQCAKYVFISLRDICIVEFSSSFCKKVICTSLI